MKLKENDDQNIAVEFIIVILMIWSSFSLKIDFSRKILAKISRTRSFVILDSILTIVAKDESSTYLTEI